MKLLKDLGLLEYGTKGKRMNYGIYECPNCKQGFRAISSRINNKNIKQCRKCADKAKRTKAGAEFSEKANKVHKGLYDYNLVNYITATTNIEIICSIHGSFWQTPHHHLKGTKCPICAREATALALSAEARSNFKEKSRAVHKGKYNYDLVEYVNNCIDVEIICPEHGNFLQTPSNHLVGSGCPSCAVTGFDRTKPAYLYYLKIITESGQILYKIGITNKTVNERFNLTDLSKIEIVKQKLYNNGQNALNWEQKLLKKYKEYQYTGPNILSSGNTELFTEDVLSMWYSNI